MKNVGSGTGQSELSSEKRDQNILGECQGAHNGGEESLELQKSPWAIIQVGAIKCRLSREGSCLSIYGRPFGGEGGKVLFQPNPNIVGI